MITRHDTRTVYTNRWMTVREDQVEFPNGTRGIYGVVHKPDFVAVVPIDTSGRIHLVRQYRYPVECSYWEIPQGSWEDKPGADPAEVALAELREETGLRAGRLTRIAHLLQAPGYSSQGYHLFVAEGLEPGKTAREETETDMISGSFTLDEIRQMVADSEIRDATTLAALGVLLLTGRIE